jgi:multidrug resistance efflux pump
MSSQIKRRGLLAGVASLLAGAIVLAQDKPKDYPVAQGAAEVFNPIEGRGVIVSSRPDGSRAAKGDIVCELDSTTLKELLAAQDLVVQSAQADVHGARIAREVAMLSVKEYKEGGFVQEMAAANREVKLAESELSRVEDRLEWSRRMYEKGYVSLAEKVTEELNLKKDVFALERAQSKLNILLSFTKEKTIKSLTGSVETARARELARQAVLERERSVQRKLIDQIKNCALIAPVGGRIDYATRIAQGSVVHDGQLLFRIIPEGTADAKAK